MPRMTLEEIEGVINALASATTRAKEARRVAKRVYGDEKEISAQLKYAYSDAQKAMQLLEMQGGA